LALKAKLLKHLPPYELNMISIHDLIGGHLLDVRKRLVMKANGAFARILERLASHMDVEFEGLLYLLPQELESFTKSPARYGERVEARREAFLVYQADFSVLDEQSIRGGIFSPMDAPFIAAGTREVEVILQRLSARLNLEVESTTTQLIRGTSVYFGTDSSTVQGVVGIVRDPLKDTIRVGDVLVATSTTPDFIGAINRCSAIITDWGGYTSHAAITARELGKPCIIGTNFASLVLRSGDLIEINFLTGEIVVLPQENPE
jgi:phosphohistidine swiveling domain-containing protein